MPAQQKKGRALITGATAGIGKACSWEFAQSGFDLLLIGRRKERLLDLAKDISQTYRISVEVVALDLSKAADVQAWAGRSGKILEEITVLINNAGLALGLDPMPKANFQDWEQMIDTNIKGLLAMTHAVLPHFVTRSERADADPTIRVGHVVNLGSVAGRFTYPNGAVYAATKFAVRALSEGLRMDVQGTGIRVTNIEPGMVETEFSEVRFSGDSEKAKAVYKGLHPLTAQDIAETIRWCLERPAHVNIQELLIMPTDQASVRDVFRKP